MRRFRLSLLLITLCGLVVVYAAGCDTAHPKNMTAQQELTIKQSLLQQDVQRTDELCRSQCAIDFTHLLHGIQPNSDATAIEQQLAAMRTEHPHMDQLIWMAVDGRPDKDVINGQIPEQIRSEAEQYLLSARQAVSKGQPYQSPQMIKGDEAYFALGVPSQDNRSALLGVIHQDILKKVEVDARKNLRIVPYPSDKRWKIESVDANTLHNVNVDHPEENEGISHYHQNQVVVKFNETITDEQIKQIQAEIQATDVQKLGYTYVFQSTQMEAKQMMDYFKKWNVAYAEPHFLYTTNEQINEQSEGATFVPNDVLFQRYQWNLPSIETTQGWEITKGSKDVIVAVIDTGIDLNHPDLQEHTISGYNLISKNKPPFDDVGHGTHVAGVISALVNNTEGVAGMTWYNPILPIKALDHTGAGSTYSVAQGVIWATDHGAKVINMSLGNYAQAQFLHDAIRYAFDRDVLLIAASGNDNTEKPGYPAAYPEVFAVAATDSHKNKAPFSNYGDYIDVAAPGVSIASTYPNNQYAALSGTSMASPHVAALAALIRSVNPMLKNTDVMEIMRQTAVDLGSEGKDKYYGYGEIDVVAALQQASLSKHSLTLMSEWLNRQLAQIEQKYTRE